MALSDGLVGYWSPWLGSSGYRLLDRTRYANHGTLTNMDAGTDWLGSTINGKYGSVLDFDGTNDGITTGVVKAITTNRLTAGIWFKPGRLTRGDLLTKWFGGGTGDQFNLLYGLTSGRAQFFVRGGTNLLANTVMSVGQWYFIVGTFGDGSISVYTNGVLDATTANAGTITIDGNGQSYSICRNLSTDGFAQGQCAEAFVHERALSRAEILQLYRLGPGWYRPYAKRGYAYAAAAGFKAYWHRRQSQVIGGGLK